jgi:uncharacterized protein
MTAGGVADADMLSVLAAFPRALAAAGLPVGPDRAASFLQAAHQVGAGSPTGVYWAGRATLTGHPDDVPVYDRVFLAWFRGTSTTGGRRDRPVAVSRPVLPLRAGVAPGADDGPGEPPVRAAAADSDVLRRKDMARLSGAERAELAAMLALLDPGLPVRRSPRWAAARHGRVDVRRSVRSMLASGGEPGPLRRRRHRMRPRQLVLLLDVSGSMAPYADSLLRFAHVLVRRRPTSVEVFTVGTRLSRVTRALRAVDPNTALAAAGEVIPDWSGGTRLGEVLRAFVDRWGRRGVARGAVVIVFSDGWERGDPAQLAEAVGELSRLARSIVWVNPHKGKDGYAPVQAGIVAVLPFLDHFLAGHSLATLEELLEVVRDA